MHSRGYTESISFFPTHIIDRMPFFCSEAMVIALGGFFLAQNKYEERLNLLDLL